MMNGHAIQSSILNDKTSVSPGYSLLRDVNGHNSLKKGQTAGRYTVISKTVTKGNGVSKGLYHPAQAPSTQLDSTRRSQSQTHVERVYANGNGQNTNGVQRQTYNGLNGDLCRSVTESTSATNGFEEKLLNRREQPQHQKSHSVISTIYLQEPVRENGNRSYLGSLSCGQPSPSSTAEDSIVSALSPTSLKTAQRPQHQSYWLHQSEIALPTDRSLAESQLGTRGQDYRTVSVTGLEVGDRKQSVGSLTNFDQNNRPSHSSSTMIYSNIPIRNEPVDYLGSFAVGPSHRKIQTLHGTNTAQRRFPSDTTLNFTSREGTQVYTSGTKPGPVTIPARSRSAQPSPGPSPLASPTTFYRASESNLMQDYGTEKRSRVLKSQQIDLHYGNSQRVTSSPPALDKSKAAMFAMNGSEDNESPILPSVREIIRQVEAMTQSNASTSTTDISTIGQSTNASGIPRYQRQPNRTIEQIGRGGILRQGGSSHRTPSAPQLRSVQYTPIQSKFNAIAASAAQSRNVAPPVPPHGTTKSKAIIGSFTRRTEPINSDSVITAQRAEYTSNSTLSKKTELLSHLPTDYQKLREAFIEQRREIQRLRKQLADKDVLINQLQSDIRLYEPWR